MALKVRHPVRVYTLRWAKKDWSDKAGHIWSMRDNGDLYSSQHGLVKLGQWDVIHNKEDTYEHRSKTKAPTLHRT